MIAHVHSIESFGTVDGPGIRFVVFLKGCPMRCQYCHNPDTWTMDGGTDMSVEEILTEYEKTRHFYTHGGITVTGGEPLDRKRKLKRKPESPLQGLYQRLCRGFLLSGI